MHSGIRVVIIVTNSFVVILLGNQYASFMVIFELPNLFLNRSQGFSSTFSTCKRLI